MGGLDLTHTQNALLRQDSMGSLRYFTLVSTSLLLGACSTFESTPSLVLFEVDGFVSSPAEQIPQSVKAGDTQTLETAKPLLYESKGYVPLLVVPVSATSSKSNVRLAPLGTNEALAGELDRVLEEILNVQTLLRDRKGREALAIASQLLNLYPRAKKIRQLKASCLTVLGEREAANALLRDPTDFPKAEGGNP